MLWDRGFWAADGDADKALRKGELRFTLYACAMTATTANAQLAFDQAP